MDKELFEAKKAFFEEKQERKLERFQNLAQKHQVASAQAMQRSDALSDVIPFGQPILVGHHSERRHRKDIDRIQKGMRDSIEHADKAEYYAQKAEKLQESTVISSDDPEAVKKLKEKLSKLEELRERIKAENKEARKQGRDPSPAYVLSNLGQNIRSVKQRIKAEQARTAIPEIDETINDIRIQVDKVENRVKMFFPEKPSAEIRTELKRNGFRWSPRNGCWQAYLRKLYIETAKRIAKKEAE